MCGCVVYSEACEAAENPINSVVVCVVNVVHGGLSDVSPVSVRGLEQ